MDLRFINSISIDNCLFSSSLESNITNEKLSALYIRDASNVKINSSIFESLFLNSEGGGAAIFMTESRFSKKASNQYFIQNCSFLNNSNNNGGAISIIDLENVFIYNSLFIGNIAEKAGGAILFSCNDFEDT